MTKREKVYFRFLLGRGRTPRPPGDLIHSDSGQSLNFNMGTP